MLKLLIAVAASHAAVVSGLRVEKVAAEITNAEITKAEKASSTVRAANQATTEIDPADPTLLEHKKVADEKQTREEATLKIQSVARGMADRKKAALLVHFP